jgi:two-component system sensor histidine kinase UhpB
VSLFWRIFLIDAAILTAAAASLLLGPVTVSTPVVLTEALILTAGLGILLVANAALLRMGLAPMQRLTRAMATVDIAHPAPLPMSAGDGGIATLIEAFNSMQERLRVESTQRNAHMLAAQEGERRRIAQELHDEVGQTLTAVLLGLKTLADKLPEPSRRELREVQETTRDGLDEIRRIARRLRPGLLEEQGLERAVNALVREIPPRAGVTVRSLVDPTLPDLSHDVELVIYRVAQESLTNTVRHGAATNVTIALRRTPQGVTLIVSDDGVGLDDSAEGSGIHGMRERALLIGADFTIGPRPSGGTEVRLDVPYPADLVGAR